MRAAATAIAAGSLRCSGHNTTLKAQPARTAADTSTAEAHTSTLRSTMLRASHAACFSSDETA
eukprot:4581198-Pleurochrysis_carterae.AAC.1